MTTYIIDSVKQDNGLYAIPMTCIAIDKFVSLDKRKELLRSVAFILMNQIHNCEFEIFNSTYYGFSIQYYGHLNKICLFLYKDYEFIDNILYAFENDDDHVTFLRKLRKHKIQKLENIL